ncbi:histidine kinase [Cytophagaceae bacterium DM2B3-1]|uniref:Histidine kinase n=1 Tax=Xanthocytophaga flava TaxID=3048013 RepID=A0ABT7CH87_9BACT|nr:histidine kinase [Xanthocytophaga flavus]MDJ1470710.1 histidine kinase [Xanthocytophaga flavus]MDJ1493108.1 histidine kinase [Xanthocytophaga flavus]
MGKERDTFLNNNGKRILFTVFAFVLLYLVSYIIDPYSSYWPNFFVRSWREVLEECLISLVFCFLISESSIRISSELNKRISWTQFAGRRLIVETGLTLLTVLLINLIINFLCSSISSDETSVITPEISIEQTRGMLQWIMVSIMIAFMIMGINTGNYLIVNWKNEAIRSAELNQVAMEAELQSLKLQIDPHFVFNNLSVLSEMILEDQQLGYEYAENFSRIYRYLLVNSKKDLISLEDELKFLNSYMFLIEHRVGEGVHFDIDVDKELRNLHMPPLTLQLLVENALKHNKTSKKDPLKIRIYNNDKQELIVENSFLPIEKPLDSSGIGIRNIIRRYNLLSVQEPRIVQDDVSFKVILSLIKL